MTMNKNADRSLILDSMPVKQALIRLAVPSILASMVTTIYNIADTFFIGQLHNTAMIAATTVAMPIMMLTHAFGESIGVSAGSYISRQLGAGHRDQVSRIVQTTMTLVVLISIVLDVYKRQVSLRPGPRKRRSANRHRLRIRRKANIP